MANQLVQMIANQTQHFGQREVYRFCWNTPNHWTPTSWIDFEKQTIIAAQALCSLQLKPLQRIAICSPNTPQILITEFAAFRNRCAATPIYAASSQEQFNFIIANSEAQIIFIGNKDQYPLAFNYWQKNQQQIKKIIIYKTDNINISDCPVAISWHDFMQIGSDAPHTITSEITKRTNDALPSDLATLIYTSGTTGSPKGVEILHSNYDAAMKMHLERLTNVSQNDLSMSFLPMSHILEKAWCYFCLTKGIPIAINYDPREIQDTIHSVNPTIMCCVPRFWEKVYVAANHKINSMNPLMRTAAKWAINIGKRRNLKYIRTGRKVPFLLEKQYQLCNRKIFAKLKQAIGIPNPNMFPTAGAPLSNKICEFMHAVGINIVIGYGLSETTATVTCFPQKNYQIGTVGTPLPGINVKISPQGEILVKAPTVTPGYYQNPQANKEAFTTDGYFRTGDAGYFNKQGALILTERIKDLFKTANGKYIAPQALESRLAENPYIDEAAVIGEGRKYVTALIVPNFHNLRKWAKTKAIPTENIPEMIANTQIQEFMLRQVQNTQQHLAPFEQIKKIALLPAHFSIMNGEITNTMKVRRPIVAKRYSREIEKMYQQ